MILNSLIAMLAFLFCRLWLKQIQDYKVLNTAKFSVLNEMSESIVFDKETLGEVVSYKPFIKEWDKMKAANQLQNKNKSGFNPLKSSTLETFMPKAFQILFALSFFLTLTSIILNLSKTIESFKNLMIL